jgi:hypothetical protein
MMASRKNFEKPKNLIAELVAYRITAVLNWVKYSYRCEAETTHS